MSGECGGDYKWFGGGRVIPAGSIRSGVSWKKALAHQLVEKVGADAGRERGAGFATRCCSLSLHHLAILNHISTSNLRCADTGLSRETPCAFDLELRSTRTSVLSP